MGVFDYEKLPVNLLAFIVPFEASKPNWCVPAPVSCVCGFGRPGIVLFARWFLLTLFCWTPTEEGSKAEAEVPSCIY